MDASLCIVIKRAHTKGVTYTDTYYLTGDPEAHCASYSERAGGIQPGSRETTRQDVA